MKWYSKEIWFNWEGWKYILVNLIGNLFPVWFLLIIEFGNNGINYCGFLKTISQPYTYLVLLIAFASSTLYLWIKNMKSDEQIEGNNKSKISIGMIIYVIFIFPIVGFYLNKKTCLEKYDITKCNCECYSISPIIYILFISTVIIYIYFQLKDFAELEKLLKKSNINPATLVNNEVIDLNKQLDELK